MRDQFAGLTDVRHMDNEGIVGGAALGGVNRSDGGRIESIGAQSIHGFSRKSDELPGSKQANGLIHGNGIRVLGVEAENACLHGVDECYRSVGEFVGGDGY
jgi:hypothetical protein